MVLPLPRSARPTGTGDVGSPDIWSRLGTGLHNNSNALIGLGSGLLSGNTFSKGLSAGGQGYMQGAQADQAAQAQQAAEEERQKAINDAAALKDRYVQFFTQQNQPQYAQAVADGIMDPGAAYGDWMKAQAGGASAPSNVQEWQYYSQLSPEEQSQYLNMKRSNTPLNIGTGFVTQDQANPGTTIGAPIAIDNQGAAFDKATGTGLGTANAANIVSYESVNSKMPGLRKVVGDLTNLADTATYTQSGQAMDSVKRELGLPVGQGAIDRTAYISIVDNQVLPLLRDTFGAAFTEREGQSLRDTLGDPNKSPAEKKVILESFIAQKERDVQAMASQFNSGTTAPGTAPRRTSTGVTYSIGQ